jgi:hypothetical protein
MRRLPSSASSSDSAIPERWPVSSASLTITHLDHQFGDVPVGLRKILLSMFHGFARTLAVRFDLDYLLIHDTRMNLLSARSLTLEPYEPSLPSLRGVPSSALEARPGMCLLGRNGFKCYKCFSVEEAAYSQSASPAFGWRGA